MWQELSLVKIRLLLRTNITKPYSFVSYPCRTVGSGYVCDRYCIFPLLRYRNCRITTRCFFCHQAVIEMVIWFRYSAKKKLDKMIELILRLSPVWQMQFAFKQNLQQVHFSDRCCYRQGTGANLGKIRYGDMGNMRHNLRTI